MKNSSANPLEISVIVSTYNRPDALDLVLSALADQDYSRFEVIVADDGSTEATTSLIRAHQLSQCRPVHHVWQPDEGFRKAEIHNQAILKAAGRYIVFLDGDCIPRPNFLSRHATLAQKGRFVTGHRIPLTQAFTEEVLANRLLIHRYSFRNWVRMRLAGKTRRLLPYIFLPDGPWRHARRRNWRRLLGCNLAVWTADLNAINGFDGRYRGWGAEDSDLAIRLISSGIHRKDGRFATGVMHLWHPENDRTHTKGNFDRLRVVLESGVTRAERGLDQSTAQYDENLPQSESKGGR